MKIVLLVFSLLLSPLAGRAVDTAYNALRVVGKKNGAETLNHVAELRGRGGVPAPAVWRIVLSDAQARGGVRELEVQGGRIISERAPTGRNLGAPMNFNALNLDSEGAFTIANDEAKKAGVAFERVDYLLRSGTGGGAPVWELQLLRREGARVATVQIAADSGTILREEGLTARGGRPYPRVEPRPPVSDRDYVPRPPEDRRIEDREYVDRRYDDRRYDERDERDEERVGNRERIRDVPSLFRRARQHFERRGVQIRNFFLGDE